MKLMRYSSAFFVMLLAGVYSAGSQSTTFTYTGNVQTYTVPPCVHSIVVDAKGAEGAASTSVSATAAGKGGRVQAMLTVTPGEVLNIYVGQQPAGNAGGWNGGGAGGQGGSDVGGGGGASDIRRGGTALSNRILVAGGGGGAGWDLTNGTGYFGGSGGGPDTGQDGGNATEGGKGGSQSDGGAGGQSGADGTAGAEGLGGDGGGPYGAGGGGGYYGGGGGGENTTFLHGGGGGGGSSYVLPAATAVNHTQGFQSGNGEIIITPVLTTGPSAPGAITGTFTVCPGSTHIFSIAPVASATSYNWLVPTGSSVAGQGSATVSVTFGAIGGDVAVTAQNSCGTSAPSSQPVAIVPGPIANAGPDITICAGQTATLAASGGNSYSWNTGDLTAAIQVTPLATTAYSVEVSNGGPCTSSDEVTVTVNPVPQVYAGADTSICAGDSVLLTGFGDGVASWTPAGPVSNPANISSYAQPSSSTTFVLQLTNAFGCSAQDLVDVVVMPAPDPAISGDTLICEGQQTTLTCTAGSTIIWNTGENSATIQVQPTATAVYMVELTNADGCSAADTFVVNVQPKINIAISGDSTICPGTVTTLLASGASKYQWNSGENTAAIQVSPPANTTYTVNASDGPCTAVAAVHVVVLPPVAADAGNDATICIGKSVQLQATGGIAYQWSPTDGLSSADIADPIASPAATTTYVAEVTDAEGCTGSDTVTVTVDACTGINEHAGQFAVYPNPSGREIFIIPAPGTVMGEIRLFDSNGRMVLAQMLNTKGEAIIVDLAALPAGIYQLVIATVNGSVSTQKITKQ